MIFLVTGAAGFIGSNFCRYVIENSQHQVIGYDSLTYASNLSSVSDLNGSRFSLVVADINDTATLISHLESADVLINFAAETHNDLSIKSPGKFVETNISGTYSVLEAIRATGKRLHHISTDEVFGDLPLIGSALFTEDSPYKPSSPYSASKASSDMLVRSWIRTFGVSATISNCSNNYGPRQHVEKFIPRQITEILMGRHPKVYGSGVNVRDWIHVEDHSRAILAIIERGILGETYLVGTRAQKTNLQVVKAIMQIMGRPESEIEFVKDRPGHDLRYAIDASKFEKEIGWGATTREFDESLRHTIDWYSANESWWLQQKIETERYTYGVVENQ
jgi:dTDP-glucose 4,6-dehydratase